MKTKCQTIENAIWDHARSQSPLSADVQSHIDNCPSCALALSEAKRLTPAIAEAGRVSPTPDCRSAVMARISAKPARRPLATRWAYACAGVLIVAVAVGGAVKMRPPARNLPIVVRKPAPLPVPKPKIDRVAQSPAPPVVPPREPAPVSAPTKAATARRTPQAVAKLPARTLLAAEPQTITAKVSPASPAGPRPIAIAEVTWPEGDAQRPDSYSYSYVDRDSITGDVTSCSVTRSGDSVEIRIETEPAAPAGPQKGSIGNDQIHKV